MKTLKIKIWGTQKTLMATKIEKKMKQTYYLLITVSLILLGSCRDDVEPKSEQMKQSEETVEFLVQGEVEPFEVVDENGNILEDETLRTATPISITARRDYSPKISILPTGTLNWYVKSWLKGSREWNGKKKWEIGATPYTSRVVNGKTLIEASFKTKKIFDEDNDEYVIFQGALSGEWTENNDPNNPYSLIFDGSTSPNPEIIEELKDGQTLQRHIPLLDYDGVDEYYGKAEDGYFGQFADANGSGGHKKYNEHSRRYIVRRVQHGTDQDGNPIYKPLRFKPSGSLLAFRLKNETGKSITVKSININFNGLFSYTGQYDYYKNDNRSPIRQRVYKHGDLELFKKFPITKYKSSEAVSLNSGSTTDGRFYIWMYTNPTTQKWDGPGHVGFHSDYSGDFLKPRDGGKVPFINFNVTYTEEGSTIEHHSASQIITPKGLGYDRHDGELQIGRAYRINLRIKPEPNVYQAHPNILNYIAKYNVNATKDGIATSYDASETGLLTWAEVQALENDPNFSNYRMPKANLLGLFLGIAPYYNMSAYNKIKEWNSESRQIQEILFNTQLTVLRSRVYYPINYLKETIPENKYPDNRNRHELNFFSYGVHNSYEKNGRSGTLDRYGVGRCDFMSGNIDTRVSYGVINAELMDACVLKYEISEAGLWVTALSIKPDKNAFAKLSSNPEIYFNAVNEAHYVKRFFPSSAIINSYNWQEEEKLLHYWVSDKVQGATTDDSMRSVALVSEEGANPLNDKQNYVVKYKAYPEETRMPVRLMLKVPSQD